MASVPCQSSFSDDLLSPVVKWNFAFELKLQAHITLRTEPRAGRALRILHLMCVVPRPHGWPLGMHEILIDK